MSDAVAIVVAVAAVVAIVMVALASSRGIETSSPLPTAASLAPAPARSPIATHGWQTIIVCIHIFRPATAVRSLALVMRYGLAYIVAGVRVLSENSLATAISSAAITASVIPGTTAA